MLVYWLGDGPNLKPPDKRKRAVSDGKAFECRPNSSCPTLKKWSLFTVGLEDRVVPRECRSELRRDVEMEVTTVECKDDGDIEGPNAKRGREGEGTRKKKEKGAEEKKEKDELKNEKGLRKERGKEEKKKGQRMRQEDREVTTLVEEIGVSDSRSELEFEVTADST